ncbi:MAG: hypothetical protein QM737_01190 [Ferruginibacter sp.]
MKPPVFFPGKRLGASDLINMEEYLLSISSIRENGYGVIRLFAEGAGIPSVKKGLFTIDEVIGITPSGRPIKIIKAKSSPISIQIDVADDEKKIADIFVDDLHYTPEKNNNSNNAGNFENNTPKYILSKDDIDAESTKIDYYKNNGNSLYLGRFVFGAAKTEMLQPPLPYFLAGIKFPSEWWNEWTKEIRDALRKRMNQHKDNLIIAPHVAEIAYNFHLWPLNRLINECNALNAFASSMEPVNALEDEFWIRQLIPKNFLDLLSLNKTSNIPSLIAGFIGGDIYEEEVGKKFYTCEGKRLLIFTMSPETTKFLKIECPESYSLGGKQNANIVLNGYERQFPPLFEEEDTFRKEKPVYFKCEYEINNDTGTFSILLDFDWDSKLKIFKTAKQ